MTAKASTKQTYALNASTRKIEGRGLIGKIIKDKKIPAVIYGKGFENKIISLKTADFQKIVKEAKTSSIIDLIIDEKEHVNVLCHEVQYDYKGTIIHADFYKVNEKEELEVEIHLNFIGEAPAKKAGLTLMFQIDEIKVKCLPKDLVNEIEVDISKLEKINDAIKISDLNIPNTLKVLEHADDIVAIVHESEELDTAVDNTDENLTAAQEAEKAEKEAKAAEGSEVAKPEEKKEEKADDKK